MSVDRFIPEVWSAKLMLNFERKLVYAGLCTRDYEGDVTQAGDTVHVNTLGNVSIQPYSPGATTVTPETLATTQLPLTIDQSHYFAFEVDDVDKRQVAGDLVADATRNGGYGFAKVVDEYIADLYTDVDSGNDLGNVNVGTGDQAYDLLLEMRTACAEKDIKPDHFLVYWASRSYFQQLLDVGVEIWTYHKGFNHSKILIVDDEFLLIGTANMDLRSFKQNFELAAAIYDKTVCAEAIKQFEEDLLSSGKIIPEKFRQRSMLQKTKESICRLVSPLL
ncbi:MAG: Major cardiolipin synthase ClsA [Candidatus Cloacimonetes bacterium ADurb.Bin003]|nr:MAG: Major cardiolipin synthase ClsA [Candidatus Cloacimonetes bacterium ADurb.Bin003]